MLLERFLNLHFRFWGFGLLISVLIFVVGIWFSRNIGINSDLKSLLPEDSATVVNMDVISPKASAGSDIRLVIGGATLKEHLEAAKAFKEYLKSKDGVVRSVRYQTPKKFLEKYKYQLIPMRSLNEIHREVKEKRKEYSDVTDPLGLEAVIEEEERQKGNIQETDGEEADLDEAKKFLEDLEKMRPYYTPVEGGWLVLRIIPDRETLNMEANRKVLEEYRGYVKDFNFKKIHPDLEAHVYGKIYDHLERYDSILSDVSFGGWGLLFIFLIVLAYFRSAWAAFILFPPLLAGVSIGTGLVTLIEGKFNIVAIFLILVVFGVGIEFGIHLWARMLQERKSKDMKESLRVTWRTTGRATITSVVALITGFALLTLSSFQGFAQFGRVAIIMLLTTAGCFLLLMPSWIVAAESLRKFKAWKPSLADSIWQKAVAGGFRSFNIAKSMRITSILIALLGAPLVALFFRFDYTYKESTKNLHNPPSRQSISTAFGGKALKPTAVAVFDNQEQAAAFMEEYEAHRDEYPNIAQMRGLPTFLPSDQKERIQKLQEISDDIEGSWLNKVEDEQIRDALRDIKDKAYDFEPYGIEVLPPEIKEPFIAADDSGDAIVFVYDILGPTDGKKSMRFADDLRQFLDRQDLDPIVSGEGLIFADVIRRVTGEGPWLVLGMFVLVFIICWIDFRSWNFALVTVSPVIFGFVMTALILVLLDIDINFFNMVAIASLGVMVVDNSIHLFHRYLGYRKMNDPLAVTKSSFAVSPTIVACTLTSISGYFGMVVANHTGIASLGFAAVLGLVCCLISAVVFFPAWLARMKFKSSEV